MLQVLTVKTHFILCTWGAWEMWEGHIEMIISFPQMHTLNVKCSHFVLGVENLEEGGVCTHKYVRHVMN